MIPNYRKNFYVLFTIFVVLLVALVVKESHSEVVKESRSEGNIGLSYNRAVDDQSGGLFGEYEHDAGPFDFEIEGQLQSGDVYDGNLNLAITFDLFSRVGVRLASDNDLKGYSLDTLGRQNNMGIDLVVPIGVGDVEFSVGIFGRNGNPFENPSALNTLLGEGFVEDELTELGLGEIYPEDRGIVLPDGSAVGAAIKGEFDVSRFEVGLKALLELFGEGEKAHQLRLDIGTNGELAAGFQWQINANLAAQSSGGVIQYETSWITGINYPF